MKTYLHRYLPIVGASFIVGILLLANLAQPASSRKPVDHPLNTPSSGHGDHQTPQGWKFAWPQGDPVKGRDVFVRVECYSCHAVQGEPFPAPGGEVGPELSVMGPLHEAEYFAEAIINPNAVVEKGKGYEDADGTSKMPSYNDLLTVQEVLDLVAYLKGLKPSGKRSGDHSQGHKAGGEPHKH